MSTVSFAVSDSATMLRRNLRHVQRYPVTMVMSLGVPILLLLLFVGVFGGALGASTGGASKGLPYIDYLVPGIILMTAGYGSSTTALAVNSDMTEGIVARFRTMAIARSSILTGHVLGAMIRTLVSTGLVIGAAMLLGFRAAGGPLDWLATIGVIALFGLALTWLAVAVGLLAKTANGTSGFVLIVQTLPFISSAFVPPNSMSPVVRWLATYEPFTPIINTMRGLLLGTPVGGTAIVAVVWCAALALAGYLWARALFSRDPVR
jgi:ABC-2 type transport system permease protein